MPEYGFGPAHGGYSQYLAGNDRKKFVKRKRKEVDVGHELEKTDPEVRPDQASGFTKGGNSSGVPTVSAVLNEYKIGEGVSNEAARTLGSQNVNPVTFNLKRSNIQMDLTKMISKKK